MEGKVVAAAENAYAESPNADPNITELLVATLHDYVTRDDYEPAYKLGKTLMDDKCYRQARPGTCRRGCLLRE